LLPGFPFRMAEIFRDRFFAAYTGIASWQDRIREELHKETRTLGGRRRRWRDQPPITEVLNSPVQGTAADIMKRAMANLLEDLRATGAKIVGCVHDEVILETPVEVAHEVSLTVRETMKKAGNQYLGIIPLEVEVLIADSWLKE
jgi:DNA polymerase-1